MSCISHFYSLSIRMHRSIQRVVNSAVTYLYVTMFVTAMTSRCFMQRSVIRKALFIYDTKYMGWIGRTACQSRKSSTSRQSGEKDDILKSEKVWDIKVLKLEVNRLYMRTFKKIGKANERLSKALIEYNDIISTADVPLKRMEECPNPDVLQADLNSLQATLAKLAYLEEELKSVKSLSNEKFPALALLADELGVSDTPPPVQERGPKKVKTQPSGPRKPYHVYTGLDGIEIRVGRGASDNDELSCNPACRDGPDWWLHVAGVAGSHVVIRSHDDNLPEKFKETLLDAAVLAVINSKGSQSGRVPVTFTRCRNVSKPRGAKAGLVYLTGDVSTIKVDVKSESSRIDRLEKNKEGAV